MFANGPQKGHTALVAMDSSNAAVFAKLEWNVMTLDVAGVAGAEAGQILSPEEHQLISAFEVLAVEPRLPDLAEVEPGALLHLVKVAWRKAGRDGRRGHLTDKQVADQISAVRISAAKEKKAFSRNQYQAMFGEGRILGKVSDYRQGIPGDIAAAYLKVALTNWRKRDDGEGFLPLLPPNSIDLDQAISNACEAMYRGDPTSELYCRPAPGPSVQQFYRERGEAGQSIIVLARKQPITMTDPESQIPEWMRLMEALLLTVPARTGNALHVWALEEPQVSNDRVDIAALLALAQLQAVLMVAHSIYSAEGQGERWDVIDQRCPIAILRRDRAQDASGASAFIDQAAVFPDTPPAGWQARGILDEKITSLVTIALTGRVTYSSYESNRLYKIPPVLDLSSPAAHADRAFRNLHLACLGALDLQPMGEAELSTDAAFNRAKDEGWQFIRPSQFIGQCFPL